MTHLRLRYAITSEPVVAPTDILAVKSGQASVLVECTMCGWRSQPFRFKARTVNLTARTHFLGHITGGLIRSWRCKRAP